MTTCEKKLKKERLMSAGAMVILLGLGWWMGMKKGAALASVYTERLKQLYG